MSIPLDLYPHDTRGNPLNPSFPQSPCCQDAPKPAGTPGPDTLPPPLADLLRDGRVRLGALRLTEEVFADDPPSLAAFLARSNWKNLLRAAVKQVEPALLLYVERELPPGFGPKATNYALRFRVPGLAALKLPFFAAAHGWQRGNYEQEGHSYPWAVEVPGEEDYLAADLGIALAVAEETARKAGRKQEAPR